MPTKKVATKAAPKVAKVPAKKVAPVAKKAPVSKAKQVLVCAPGEQCFWTTDGRILSNLLELRDALESMTDDVFAYHVSKERNDFADWIEHVLGDAELAAAFRKSKKVNTAHDVVVTRLRIYSI